jgi:hypothetical protein
MVRGIPFYCPDKTQSTKNCCPFRSFKKKNCQTAIVISQEVTVSVVRGPTKRRRLKKDRFFLIALSLCYSLYSRRILTVFVIPQEYGLSTNYIFSRIYPSVTLYHSLLSNISNNVTGNVTNSKNRDVGIIWQNWVSQWFYLWYLI